jgi:hypothetical protein
MRGLACTRLQTVEHKKLGLYQHTAFTHGALPAHTVPFEQPAHQNAPEPA